MTWLLLVLLLGFVVGYRLGRYLGWRELAAEIYLLQLERAEDEYERRRDRA